MSLAITRTRRPGTLRAAGAWSPAEKKPLATPESYAQPRSAVTNARRNRSSFELPATSNVTKLDSPPSQKGSDSPVVTGREEKRRSSWDPLARYHSEAHSFPDYGSPGDKMGSKRLVRLDIPSSLPVDWSMANTKQRQINAATAGGLNTLTNPPRPHDVYSFPESPRVKRHKQIASSPNDSVHRSPYFTDRRNSEVHDLTGASQEDASEVISNSSFGKSKSAQTGVCEYRQSQPTGPRKPRVRKSRSSSGTNRLFQNVQKAQIIDVEVHGRRNTVESPDVLAEHMSPPPANITTDIARPGNKRLRPKHLTDMSSPHLKRARIPSIEDIESEDELSKDTGGYQKKGTTISVELPTRGDTTSRAAKADMQRTQFINPARSRPAATRPAVNPTTLDLCVKNAVSGKHFYIGDDEQRGRLLLRLTDKGPATLVPQFETGETTSLEWMKVRLDSIIHIQHSLTNSHYVHISRPRGNNVESNLSLELADHKDVMCLTQAITDGTFVELTPESLEIRWKQAMEKAKSYDSTNRRKSTTNGNASSSRANALDDIIPTRETEPGNEPTAAPRKGKLIDNLRTGTAREGIRPTNTAPGDSITVSHAPATRRTRRSSPVYVTRELSPDRWTSRNPDWREYWHKSLVFPPTGKNRAIVDDNDITRLDEGEFLNDNLISFYVRYLQFKLESEKPELLNKVYIFSTFFFEKLRSTRGKINYDGVKAWTAKFDLLSYDYIVVPVNENSHWYLAIICNTPNAVSGMPEDEEPTKREGSDSPGMANIARDMLDVSIRDDDATGQPSTTDPTDLETVRSPPSSAKTLGHSSPSAKKDAPSGSTTAPQVDSRLPKIVTLDSLGLPHATTCRALKEYLIAEAKDKRGVDLAMVPTGMTAKRIPEQDNYCDCGVFILGYMEEFLKDPDESVRKLFQKEPMKWDIRPPLLRNQVRDLLFKLQEEQQERLEKEKIEKRLLSAKKREAARAAGQGPQSAASPTPMREKLARKESAASSSASASETPATNSSRKDEPDENSSSQTKKLPSDDNEVTLVKAPKDDSSTTGTPGDVFYSAPSAPSSPEVKAVNGTASKAKPKDIINKTAKSPDRKRAADHNLVHTLPGSSSEVEVQITKTTPSRPKRVSIQSLDADEVVAISPNRVTRQQSRQVDSSPPLVQPLRSSQSTSPKKTRAKYDGIDRSVDLT